MLDIDAIKRIKAEVGEGVKIVAATKTVPAEIVDRLKDCGIMTAGENRVQELLEKYDRVSGLEWHFIGQLQTNKVRFIVDKVSMIQSVDRTNLVDEIERQCAKINKKMDILLEVNCGEDSKGGVDFDGVFALADYAATKPHICIKGLMAVPPPAAQISLYAEIFTLFERLKQRFDTAEFLSCGMSADYLIAAQHGANIIRLGSVLFGKRAK